MNNKGFTLIEILACITIIGLIATIASTNITKIFTKKEETTNNVKENILTTAACLYIELDKNKDLKETCLKNGCDITTNDLLKAGLLEKEDVSNLKVIHIYKENNEKKCQIK